MKRLLPFFLLIAICLSAPAQTWQDTVNIITHLFGRYKPGNPGCQLAISRNGKLVFSLGSVFRRQAYHPYAS